jgi:hypothetical protein
LTLPTTGSRPIHWRKYQSPRSRDVRSN